jgi:hypothetical protein
MTDLAKMQAGFQAYLLDSTTGAAFKSQIVDDAKIGISKRLSIYSDAYRLRIIEALGTAYPYLKALLGDDLFAKTATQYIAAYPSTYRNMRWVGGQMAAHLQQTLPQYPVAAEMATFEWALSLAFDATEVPNMQLQELANIPPENWAELRFELQPCIQLCNFSCNTVAVWQALNNQETPPKVTQQSTHWLIWRQDLDAHFRSLSDDEFKALQQVQRGKNFGDLCEQLATTHQEQAGQQAAQFLVGWIEIGILKPLSITK